ncbi:aminotransferase class I/II-fold pyridoxal phosphate-dependent enzyme [Chelativorans sp. AA-79]|uniref:pyridoxal phosphate-dependent aminotransferase n=1 Tax=Chelativorans sp. AA-79 TaxID=3028735 RepID=UPI0023F810E4|nr:aminotransferase class I/II-fold pyridoxal phosphate-dependent enzyme [Chelativorans sp. AA-79]WEX11417.1 aminotransferase class I/II-fold pyridoxal phosphate-dependent enzyme [Chelativorans sp. AA-79]
MPKTSERILGIMPSGKDGWEVHFAAMTRKQAGEDILMLSVGDHDFDTPVETVAACVEAVQNGYHHYIQLPGLPRLREGLAGLSTACTGIDTAPEEVIVTQGGQGALFAACQAVLDPGSHAIIISPYYATYPGTVRAAGGRFTEIETRSRNGFEPDVEAIAEAIRPETRMILVNSPNNPTGAVYSRATMEAIAEICRRHDLWLLSDEVYWTLRADRAHVSPRSLSGMKERTLVVNSLSKSHGMTGWRVGWLTAPTEIVRHLVSLNIVSSYGMVDFVSRAAIAAVENGFGVADIAARYAGRRKAFLDAIRGLDGAVVRGSEGGMYVMLDISQVSPDAEAFAWGLLEAEKVAVMPGPSFGTAAEGHIRVSMCQDEPVLREAAGRIRRYIAAQTEKQQAAE